MAEANHRIRFMINNRAEDTLGSFSSEDTLYPFTNTQSKIRQTYWLQTGYFNVTASNQVIYFNDGADKSVNIPIAEYTDRTVFVAAIMTALNSVSSNWMSSYVSYSGYIKIERSSGTGILRVSQTINSIWNLIGFTGSTDITAGKADAKRWHEKEFVKWDFGTSVSCTFFAGIYKAGKDFPLTQSGTYRLQANNIDDFTSPPLDELMTTTEDGLFHVMDAEDTNYRFWLFTLIDNENPLNETGLPISHIYLGDHRTMSTTNVQRGFSKSIVDPTKRQTSIGGQEYFDLKTKYFTYSNMSVIQLTETERLEIETIFDRVGISEPFYLSVDPKLCITSRLNDMTRLVRWDGKAPTFQQLFLTRFNVSFAVKEVL